MALKILLVSEYFFPKSTGGTELYVYNLAHALIKLGNQVTILTCADDGTDYVFNELSVITIPFNKNQDTKVIKEIIPADNLNNFTDQIIAYHADIIHFHTLTTSINFFHIQKAKNLGYPVALTSHIPGHLCLRGDLVHLNKEVCDGVIEGQKCLSCNHLNKGIAQPFNQLSAALVKYIDYVIPFIDPAKNKKRVLLKLNSILDAIVVVSEWQRGMFIANGFSAAKLHTCRQAIAEANFHAKKKKNKIFTIGFTGRISKGKGLHILLDALKNIDQQSFCLKITAIPVRNEMPYFLAMKNIATSFKNNVWIENLPNEEIGAFMSTLDVLCVPSVWLETGPFVAYESIANGTPVLGSNIGGIKELVKDNENGWLFEFNNTASLLKKVTHLIKLFSENEILPIKNTALRTSVDMAKETLATYQQIIR